jgi:lysophospholipase
MVNEAVTRRSLPAGAIFSTWFAPDGWAIRRMDWLQNTRKKPCGNLVFAGGRGDFIEKYLEALAYWHCRGWNVTTFDWRGQGRSQGGMVRGNLTSFDPLIDDCAALLADWRGEMPGPHVAIGHSMGGHLLLRTIVERAPALDAAVLVAPMIGVNSAPFPLWLAPDITDVMSKLGFRDQPMWKVPTAMKRVGGRRQYHLTSSRERYEDELYWWAQQPDFDLGAPSWGWMRAAYRSAERSFRPEQLRAVTLPILVLATDRDRLVSTPEIRRVAAELGNAELHAYVDSGHEILRESDPVRRDALARIDAFLANAAR